MFRNKSANGLPITEKRTVMDHKTYTLLENHMLSCMTDSAHDKEHIYRVLYNALIIAKTEENVDTDILITACLLHDIGRQEQFENPALSHAIVGSEKAYRFLTEQGYDAAFAQHVKDCIITHSYRIDAPPASIEAKILFDADKLDAAGAVGIARTLIYKGQVQEPLYTMNPDGTVCDGTNTDDVSFFEEYKHKLEKLYSGFHTKTGIAMAKERQQTAVRYYEALLAEVSAPYVEGRNALEHILD